MLNRSQLKSTVGIILLLVFAGCAKRPSQNASQDGPRTSSGTSKPVAVVTSPANDSVDPALAKTMPAEELAFSKRYGQAVAYSDVAQLTLSRLLEDGRTQETQTTVMTRYAQPNRIQLQIISEDNSVNIVSDGKQIAARILDPVTQNFHGQVVLRKAPSKLSISDLYQVTELVDPIAPNEMLSALLAVPAGLDVLPLSLLLNEGKLAELAGPSLPHKNLGFMELSSGERCDVVAVEAKEGTYRFWIAEETLRRIELPPLTRDLLPGVKQLSLTIDLTDVSFAAEADPFPIQEGGTKVRHFVLPPIPPVTDQLGKQIAMLRFSNRNRQEVQVANDAGQSTVLVWYGNHPESRMVLQAIEQVRRRNRSDRVRLAAVAMDSTAGPELLSKWQVETAWLEDRSGMGRRLLEVQQTPTVVVLGPKNRLDYFEVGANPNVGADVAVVLERLLAGQNVAEGTKSLYEESRTNYERILARAKIDGDGWVEELNAKVPRASAPEKLKLTEVWKTEEVEEPGNFLIVPGKQKRLLVVDGWNQLAMMSLDGKVTNTIKLDLPENEGISILRAGSNGRDRALIAAASRGGRQAFLFDFAGKRVAQYPPGPSEHVSISDLLVHNIGDGEEPEMIVAWQGDGGVHGIGLDGKHHWSNQAATGVISVSAVQDEVAGGAKRKPILTTSESGFMFLVDEHGRTLREVRLEQVVHQLAVWPGTARGFESILNRDLRPSGQGNAVYLGIASSSFGGHVITGISGDWQPLWSHSMPRGVYRHQVDFPQAVSIPGIGAIWIVPGPDGSVHFLSADGKFRDQMYVGSQIRGLAATPIGDKPALLIAIDGKVTANELEFVKPD